MKLSKLTTEGISAFIDFLDNTQPSDVNNERDKILKNNALVEIVSSKVCIDVDKFPTSKFLAAEYLYNMVYTADVQSPEKDVGLWSWLSLLYFEKVCKKDSNGSYKQEELFKWVLDPLNYLKYYRHKLAGPCRIYKTYKDKPDIAMTILAGTINTPGEVYEQLASRQEIVSNSSIIELATYLYYDQKNNKLKTGAAGKDSGASRRLTAVIQQFSRTWDLYGMKYKEIARLLPNEFNKFMS